MAIFSTNQARHLYVAKALGTVNEATGRMKETTAGTILPTVDADKNLFFEYVGKGGLLRSDLIDVKNIIAAKATDAAKMATPLKEVTVTVEGDIKADDYILKIVFQQFAGMSDEDIYTKFGMVKGTEGMIPSNFYKELALSLAKNFSKELTKLVKISLKASTGNTEVTADTKDTALTGSYTGVAITEVEQEWTLGIKPQVPVYFEVLAGDWGKVATATAGTVANGKKIADLEYFCMGERGDIYRGVGFPNNVVTEYMVEADKAYHTLDIHYAYVGSNEAVQKSEKDITIVCADKEVLNSVISAINAAADLTIATL